MDADEFIDLALGEYAKVRTDYRNEIYAQTLDYLTSEAPEKENQDKVRDAIIAAFLLALLLGYADGGADEKPPAAVMAWMLGRQAQEIQNVDNLFKRLEKLRADDELTPDEANEIAKRRADGYTDTLDSIYGESKVRGAGETFLTFGGQDGHPPEYPCPECKKLKGQRHRASWWVRRGFVPYPGNPNFTCGTWQCKHILFDDTGKVYTV